MFTLRTKFLMLLLLFWHIGYSENLQSKIDSLKSLLKKDKEDTNQINHLNVLGLEYKYINPDTSYILFKEALSLAEKTKWQKGKANALRNIGGYHLDKGNYPQALNFDFDALKINETIHDKNGIAKTLGNIGIIYEEQTDCPKALNYYFRALKMGEELGNKNLIAIFLGNIGNVYKDQVDYSKALDYHFRALKIREELGTKKLIASTLGNIGIIYQKQANYPKALDYYFKAMKMGEEIGDKKSQANALGNIGNLYTETKKYTEAEKYLLDAGKIFKEIGAQNYEREEEASLTKLYEKTNRYQLALEHYKKEMLLKDSIFSQEKNKEITRKEMNFEFEKKEAAQKAEQNKKDAVTAEQSRRERVIRYSVIGGLVMMFIIAVIIFRSLRITSRQKIVIEKQKNIVDEQKKLVEEKNKDITDSINYAQRIQRALLASEALLNKNLGEYFVFFKPKDIVSGDFYWATEKDGRFYLAVCDSTGHGVPGAFMSLLNISFLNEAINEEEVVQPNEIFNHVRQRLIENISQDGGKDGMDGILVCFDKKKKEVTYAGANNAPMLMNGTLQELATDNMPVGLGEKKDSFTHHTISFQSGNILYLYTDGFADQFGGPKGKKFKYKPLNEILASISDMPMAEQRNTLEHTFVNWKGNLEQVDDVLVIGIRI